MLVDLYSNIPELVTHLSTVIVSVEDDQITDGRALQPGRAWCGRT